MTAVSDLVFRYPVQSSALTQAAHDLEHSCGWSSVEPLPLDKWGCLHAKRPNASKAEVVVPVSVDASIPPADIKGIFTAIQHLDVEQSHILIAVVAQDSTTVYYKLARGIVKPVN